MAEEKDLLIKIGTRIRKLRLERGLTQEELGKRVGISSSMISLLERGERAATAKSLITISEELGTTLNYLFSGERDEGMEMETLGKRVYKAAGGDQKKIEALIMLLKGN